VEEEERVLHGGGGGWAPFIAAKGGGRRRCGGRETVAVKPWAWARQWRPLSEGGQRGLGTVGPRD
jgi:hypothetical protein